MSRTLKALGLLASSVCLLACQAVPLTTATEPVDVTRSFKLAVPFRATASPGKYGLVAGEYVPERKNTEGTFYRGPGLAVVSEAGRYGFAATPGGVWIPTKSDAKPRIYAYVGKETLASNDFDALLSGTPPSPARSQQASSSDLSSQFAVELGSGTGIAAGNPRLSTPGVAAAGSVATALILTFIDANASPEPMFLQRMVADQGLLSLLHEQGILSPP